jgi:Rha family phage regulatory protein
MTNLTIINQNGQLLVDSREVAEMIGKRHDHLLRDIDGYAETLNKSDSPKLGSQNFFIKNTYFNSQSKEQPCYLITKKGCDMVANKMTGEKGILFTATYVTKFEEMEQTLKAPALKPMTQAEIIAASAQQLVEIERKVLTLDSKVTNALDIFTTPAKDDWRHEMNDKINQICLEQDLSYQGFRHEIYTELENTARVDLSVRQLRLRKRMKKEGATVTECKAISKLDIVERDPKLRPIFEGIVRKYQAKYAVIESPNQPNPQ